MTAATQTRPTRSTKKKATTKGKGKKPTWGVISFKKIEEWRVKLGLTKGAMAEALGVTNSTFHNWRRGTTVPHPAQQDEILQRIQVLEKNAGSAPAKRSVSKPPAKKKTTKKARATKKKRTVSKRKTKTTAGKKAKPNKAQPSSPRKGVVMPASQSAEPQVIPTEGVSAITTAWLANQTKAVSAASTLDFVRQLRQVL